MCVCVCVCVCVRACKCEESEKACTALFSAATMKCHAVGYYTQTRHEKRLGRLSIFINYRRILYDKEVIV